MQVKEKIKIFFDGIVKINAMLSEITEYTLQIREILIKLHHFNSIKESSNILNKFEKKIFSQSGEDGITLEIVKRLALKNGVFVEIGPGQGTECNTLVLLAMGWTGTWIGNEDLLIKIPRKKLQFYKKQISIKNLDNVVSLALNNGKPDLISIDIDSIDYYLTEELLKNNIGAKIFIVEYNANFSPPISFNKKTHLDLSWQGDTNYGASLQTLVNLFSTYKYTLVACNAMSGANAFFIQDEFINLFSDINLEIHDLYHPPFYFFPIKNGHRSSIEAINDIISD
jgi:hypothetical protein